MNRNLRKTVIAGNWKMNMTPSQTTAFMKELSPMVTDAVCDVVLCVPAIDIPAAVAATAGTNIHVGAENVHFEEKGAFTGEISAQMLTEAGVTHVVIGHSERRQYFGETDHTVNLRTKAAVEAGLHAITCVGETLEQREQGITAEIVSMQTKIALLGLDADEMKRVIIAYEPVWAIGTGKTATAEQAQEVCKIIRDVIASLYGDNVAQATSILYGGSMNAKNAAELLEKEDVDGGLIGGASLKTADFTTIVHAAG